mmetsp:Transcript_21226/g.35026  ORF Transcript_21226/g.35026 Transcript_21226/m.35026 type:complete len:252 (+) Transcript_21226:132-887(+)
MKGLQKLLVFVFTTHLSSSLTAAFSFGSNPRQKFLHVTSLQASPLQDVFSGITGIAPSSIEPPTDLLIGTSIDPTRNDVQLERVYKATKDGWSAIDFHNCVDTKGSAIVVALTKSGKRFGGFNPLGWSSTDDYGNSNNAFLWFEKNGKGVKLPILAGGNTAIYDIASAGPTFGAADLCLGPPKAAVMGGFTGPSVENVSSVSGSLRKGKSSVGGCFDYVRGWPVAGEFSVVEVEVYCNARVGKRSGGLFGF